MLMYVFITQLLPFESVPNKLLLVKSDIIERKLDRFTVTRTGEGNVRFTEPVLRNTTVDTISKERVVRSIRLKVVSGGMKDHIVASFQTNLDQNIHVSKPPEQAQEGSVVYNFKRAILLSMDGLSKVPSSQVIPRISTSDRLLFYISSHSKVALYHIDILLLQRPFHIC